MQSYSPGKAPIVKGDNFARSQCHQNNQQRAQMQSIPYASVVSNLMYAQVCTRGAVSWKSVKQALTASSTMEAEYPLKIYCDNSAAVAFSRNTRSSSRSKHIDIKFLFVREKVMESVICVEHISTGLMLADPLTKGLAPRVFQEHATHMGLIEFSIVFS
ncbi:hypothetical protein ACOSQ2_023329 [Xanthoceras sorbifolium]